MTTITKANFVERPNGKLAIHGSAEASSLGLKPGQWPITFDVEGFGQFVQREILRDGSRVYGVPFTLISFTIWND